MKKLLGMLMMLAMIVSCGGDDDEPNGGGNGGNGGNNKPNVTNRIKGYSATYSGVRALDVTFKYDNQGRLSHIVEKNFDENEMEEISVSYQSNKLKFSANTDWGDNRITICKGEYNLSNNRAYQGSWVETSSDFSDECDVLINYSDGNFSEATVTKSQDDGSKSYDEYTSTWNDGNIVDITWEFNSDNYNFREYSLFEYGSLPNNANLDLVRMICFYPIEGAAFMAGPLEGRFFDVFGNHISNMPSKCKIYDNGKLSYTLTYSYKQDSKGRINKIIIKDGDDIEEYTINYY